LEKYLAGIPGCSARMGHRDLRVIREPDGFYPHPNPNLTKVRRQTMNRITLLILGVAFSLMLFGCGGTSNPVISPVDDGVRTVDWTLVGPDVGPVDVDLWFGTGTTDEDGNNIISIGGVATIWTDGDTLYVTGELFDSSDGEEYAFMDGYYMEDLHIHYCDAYEDIPFNRGRWKDIPAPGHFMYEQLFDIPEYPGEGTRTFSAELPWDASEWTCDSTMYFLLHLTVWAWDYYVPPVVDEYGNEIEPGYWVTKDYTGWGGDEPGNYDDRWWTYFEYTDFCECVIDLPDDLPSGTFVGTHNPGGGYYWKFVFTGVGEGDVENGVPYYGYCVQLVSMNPGQTYAAYMYDPLHDTLPGTYSGVNWGAINWVLNNKYWACDNPTYGTIQAVIWWIAFDNYPSTSGWTGQGTVNWDCAHALYNEAVDNHSDFVPVEGDLQAVLLYGMNSWQSNIFEMEIDCVD
jgi:hypothetical protein